VGDEGACALAAALAGNTRLQRLGLGANRLGAQARTPKAPGPAPDRLPVRRAASAAAWRADARGVLPGGVRARLDAAQQRGAAGDGPVVQRARRRRRRGAARGAAAQPVRPRRQGQAPRRALSRAELRAAHPGAARRVLASMQLLHAGLGAEAEDALAAELRQRRRLL